MTDSTIITRFNPTSNGLLHLGHIYTALVNIAMAKSTGGGRAVLRLEDNQDHLIDRIGHNNINLNSENILRDLEWLGIKFDQCYLQSSKEEVVRYFLLDIGETVVCPLQPRRPQFYPITPGNKTLFMSYTPVYTLEKVVLDYLDNVTYLIRGLDLISEHSLYCYYCQVLNLPIPEGIYLPRLQIFKAGDLNMLSKTVGGYTIQSFREKGFEPNEVMELLAKACLIDPRKDWVITNIKNNPIYIEEQWTKTG